MKHIFIINPIAGKGKLQENIEKSIHHELKTKKVDYEVYFSKSKDDIKTYITNKCGDNMQSVFYACGGDGTLHEVVNACIGFENAYIGVIPCGSGNDFVKNFDNRDYFHYIDSQVNGKAINLDLIKVKDKYTVSVCNIGFDADAAFSMHKFKKIPFITGSGCYIMSVIYNLSKKLGKELEVIIDKDEVLKGSFLLGVVANGHSYGGGYKCAPLAEINDGIMDLCFVSNISRVKILSVLGSYKEGTHLTNEKLKDIITYKKCKHVKIKSKEPINICIDGENFIHDEIELEAVKDILKFWIPEGVRVQAEKSVYTTQ
ncbi:YegS/Rv2252/BmrU family lipid kinase [Sedimentibacter hydroxybenzoicus DSM 7310]|uniref:YegS/Rv2252/BmrU family lipid kinase n=1 Tax=Sedimentibacter hydroxybenzoicus DSM 7310 TaxID=1123245 RepID=A0A974BK20_SEDHY|nr:YegS/Rv2252/BmrU family lipid kinase [Sedimentibacter hydroxybenzoicus]NYB74192.1 YegS/Rv2252/BmrU family lipid kinase [Sedimentibacter hydroxybenzoicus DSM 7310]